MAQPVQSTRNTFVLCFDGTGNKFSGSDSDSNILKIYRMLDRTQGNTYHYYQPGIGTYVTSSSLDHTSVVTRLKSWYDKAKDSAVGSNFGDHVMGGYRFLSELSCSFKRRLSKSRSGSVFGKVCFLPCICGKHKEVFLTTTMPSDYSSGQEVSGLGASVLPVRSSGYFLT